MSTRRKILLGVLATAGLLLAAAFASGRGAGTGSDASTAAAPADVGFFGDLFRVYMPRHVCMNDEGQVIWLHVFSDLLIALAYFSIPGALIVFVRRRRDLAFNWMFQMFAVFIFACGITHVVGVWNIWQPLYRVDGLIKLFTGIVSAATAVLLWRLIPAAVALPSPTALAAANAELSRMHHDLEMRVADRTRELAEATHREHDARTEAERANRAKDDFLATLSHELRTPLNAIMGWAHMLSHESLSREQRHKGMEVIARSARVQNQLIEDLLDMSRIISGRLRLDLRDLDLVEVIDGALETIEPVASAKNIQVSKVLDPRVGLVRGDPDRLKQVVWNLLSNAVKFTPAGGRISVILERVNSHVEIGVADTGPGLNPALLPHIFDRFQQGTTSLTRREGGLGLGLAIVRHLVELHGGTVHANNAGDGTGARFVVRLPLVSEQAATNRAESRADPVHEVPAEFFAGLLTGVKVLAVDDEADARDLVACLLQQAGAEVRTACSAAEALALLSEFRADVIVSDLGMPGDDGLSLMRNLRQRASADGGDAPAVALTAFARPEDRRAALRAGFQMHLAKPVDPTELALAVAGLARRRQRAHPA